MKPLPLPEGVDYSNDDGFVHEFARNDVRELIHCITQELKLKGSKTQLVLLAFRPKISDTKLSEFLAQVIPNGSVPANLNVIEHVVKNTDEYTLVTALKYLWARLPRNAIIGWEAYETFKRIEVRDNYPKKAFLEYMPQCLSSPSHASIVYDFLDLIVAFASNSKDNQLSGRKIAKMCGIWAFDGSPDRCTRRTNTFADGLRDWLPAADAMFHLLLSFLRSMLPDDYSTKLQLPRTLQALLASNSYPPPPDLTYASTTVVSVPLVTIRSNALSNSPVEMLNKIPKVLTFDNPDIFQAKEDFALLKSLCKTDDNILNKLSSESRRIVQALCRRPIDTNLKPNWPEVRTSANSKPIEQEVQVSRTSIDDYFIWTWLASISFEETNVKKKIFGRSLIMEVVFDGFKKWIIVEEVRNVTEITFPSLPEKPKIKKTFQPHYKSMLDDLPDDAPQMEKKVKKKEKPKPLPKPLPNIQIQQKDKGMSMSGFLKPLKRTYQQHQPQSITISRPDAMRNISEYKPPEEVEPLPEIEPNMYRLSIPLDRFGFDERVDQDRQEDPGSYSEPVQGYREPIHEEYNYWSTEGNQEVRSSSENIHHAYEHAMAMLEPSYVFNEEEYVGESIQNLSSMVDEISIQMNYVEKKKLGKPNAPPYDYEVPLPQENITRSRQPDTQDTRRKSPTPDTQDENVPPSEAGSSIYGPVPSVTSEYDEPTRKVFNNTCLGDSKVYNQDSQVSSISYPKGRSQDLFERSQGLHGQRVRSMVDEVTDNEPRVESQKKKSLPPTLTGKGNSPSIPSYKRSDRKQPVSKAVPLLDDTTYAEAEVSNGSEKNRSMGEDLSQNQRISCNSISTIRQTVDSVDACDDARSGESTSITEKRRMSNISNGTNKYPDSILDNYNYTNSEASPTRTMVYDSFVNDGSMSRKQPIALSLTDVRYIPESSLPDIPIPVPSPPRSPLSNKRAFFPPVQTEVKPLSGDGSQVSIEPVPSLAPRQNTGLFSSSGGFQTPWTNEETPGVSEPPPSNEDYQQKPLPSMLDREFRMFGQYDVQQQLSPQRAIESDPEFVRHSSPKREQQLRQRKAPSTSPVRSDDKSAGAPHGRQHVSPDQVEHISSAVRDDGSSGSSDPAVGQQQSSLSNVSSNGLNQDCASPKLPSPGRQMGPKSSHLVPGNADARRLSPNNSIEIARTSAPLRPNGARSPQYYPSQYSQGQYPPQGQHFQGQYPSPGQYPHPPPGMYQYPVQYPPQGPPKRASNGSSSSLPSQYSVHQKLRSPHTRGETPDARNNSLGGAAPGAKNRSPNRSNIKGQYPLPQGQYPPPQAFYPPSYGFVTPPSQKGYYLSPQGYTPQGYPPQGYPPQGYYPPPQGYYPPPQGYGYPPIAKPTGSDFVMQSLPPTNAGNKLHHNGKADKKNIRAALTQGDFGI
jgi:hypothetical protein